MIRAVRMPPGRIVDTAARLTLSLIADVHAAGFGGVARYVPHVGAHGAGDITAAEAEAVWSFKMGLLLVQHVRAGLWSPAAFSGHDDGACAASRALAIGYPKGAHVFADLESIAGPGAPVIDYAETWGAAVAEAGYRAGVYVGFAVPLSADALYRLRGVTSYWSDPGPRQVSTRGFAMHQALPIRIDGVKFDPDQVAPDAKGETPYWAVQV